MTGRGLLENWARRHWWRKSPSLVSLALRPMSQFIQWLVRHHRRRPPARLPVPVIVVGNMTVGGAGKTPTVIAVTLWLQAQGQMPGVISRGYGRQSSEVVEVTHRTGALEAGDEPLLIHRRTGAPLFVGSNRVEAALALLARHPDVSILVSDDGLQHRAMARDLQIIVFDERGVGNGLTLPAGPLREPLPVTPPADSVVVYNAPAPTMSWPGETMNRSLAAPVPLSQWWSGQAKTEWSWSQLASLSQNAPVLAMAGTASPERFFGMLEARGLRVNRLPQADHAHYGSRPPWPASTELILVTEKDAVKLNPADMGRTLVLVVALDFQLPSCLTDALSALFHPGAASHRPDATDTSS